MSARDGREWPIPVMVEVPVEESLMAIVVITIAPNGDTKLNWQGAKLPPGAGMTEAEYGALKQLIWPNALEAVELAGLPTVEADPPAPGGTLT